MEVSSRITDLVTDQPAAVSDQHGKSPYRRQAEASK